MKKILTVLMMFSLLLLLLSGCTEEQTEIDPQKIDETIVAELAQEEMEHIAEIEIDTNPAPSSVPIQDVESVRNTDNPQIKTISNPIETATPTPTPKPIQSQTPAATPKPTSSNETTQRPSQTSTPAPQTDPEPVLQPIPIPQPTPEQTPQPASAPPPVAEPPPARTICNTCGADITGNVAAHGTIHLHNDENFSYRVE
jgi:outer membrane biosynthesis protein TonB